MGVIVVVCVAFGFTISEDKTEVACLRMLQICKAHPNRSQCSVMEQHSR